MAKGHGRIRSQVNMHKIKSGIFSFYIYLFIACIFMAFSPISSALPRQAPVSGHVSGKISESAHVDGNGSVSKHIPISGNFLVKKSFYYMRGAASISSVEMVIHRPEWERTMTINAWTLGEKNSIFFITAPPKDNGNGTLKKGRKMWIFNPKINRIIKLPPSMMSQSWMGSDFSNNDLSKTDSLLNDYTHRIINIKTENGLKIYTVQSIPKPEAPVIWGMLELEIRQDFILIKEIYFDEDNKPVKILSTSDIRMMGNRLFPRIWKMQKTDAKNKYTLLVYKKLIFVHDLPARLFTLSNLKNPGIQEN